MILVFGRTGQVARELHALGDVISLGREEADLCNPAACAAVIRAHAPAAVVNAAAYTGVDQAESDEETAMRVNGVAPKAMAEACAALNIPFVHISTDYVFGGSGAVPFTPDATTGPLGAYGRTKLAGERAVRLAGGVHAILRTSWVFSAHGTNFVKTILRLATERDSLNIVSDQIGGPTPADEIAAGCVSIAGQLARNSEKSGTYHFAGTPDISWARFACEIIVQAGLNCTVTEILSSQYPTPALRPANSRLDCAETARVFGLPRPDWRSGLARVLRKLEAQEK
jgi:dTDP-4-dehydrorhamnose reductase